MNNRMPKSYGGNNKNHHRDNQDFSFEIISMPLKDYFDNPADLYLPSGKAEKYARLFQRIQNHQMRKVLDLVKESKVYAERSQFEQAKKQIFMIVAMSAYNSGRNSELKPLYEFIKNTINEKTIQSVQDILAFDQFFTSVVAYHKQYSRK